MSAEKNNQHFFEDTHRLDEDLKKYIENHPELTNELYMIKVRTISKLLNGRHFNIILDAGCGGGIVLRELSCIEHQNKIALDVSTKALKITQNVVGKNRTHFVRGDLHYLPFKNANISLALAIDVVEHLHHPQRALKEFARTSEHIVVRVPLEDSIYVKLQGKRWNEKCKKVGHIQRFNRTSLIRLIRNNGFKICSIKVDRYTPELVFFGLKDTVGSKIKKLFYTLLSEVIYVFMKPFYPWIFGFDTFLTVLCENEKHKRNIDEKSCLL